MTLLAQFAALGGIGPTNYIEDVFNTWLYTGTGSARTITNGIDLAGKGGLVWIKSRSTVTNHLLFDTSRGALNAINSDNDFAQTSLVASLTSFNANGFSLSTASSVNAAATPFASWTFRDQLKFFDVVTYTGTGANRTVAHSLGAVPGCIMVKRTNGTGAWQVYHRANANTEYMVLDTNAAVATGATRWNSTTPTDAVFSLGTDATVNASGGAYVAYLFAHNAGGFGLTSADNVISCGSYTGNGSTNGPVVSLGYEPQWLMIKNVSGVGDWVMQDVMRGMPVEFPSQYLRANATNAEDPYYFAYTNATGFQIGIGGSDVNTNGATYLYIAIRRGPMKVPTTGASVFGLSARTGTDVNATVTGNAGATDLAIVKNRGSTPVWLWASRLTNTGYLSSNATSLETAAGTTILQANPWDVMDGIKVGTTSTITNASANTFINYLFDRAPGFFDVVCYTGTGANRTVAHNLAAVPELMIVKRRSASPSAWAVYAGDNTDFLQLNTTAATADSNTYWNDTSPTTSVFSVSTAVEVNATSATYIAYLFASCLGVSKVGSYTGTNAVQTINCGFTAGSRFVMIKRTDSTGDWYVWDSTRGIVPGNDPYLLLNSTAAEVTTTDWVDTAATGFQISSTAPAAINASGGSYIFLAIA